ncbi:MAG: DUF1549 domain-containing protein [Planctomycetaceae bacterium]|nr:DUF1549 domain-containing protein [Planctomycetaceae bacterium]
MSQAAPQDEAAAATETSEASKPTENTETDNTPTGLINAEIAKAWADHGVKPSPPEEDGKWCRRVYLDVLGRIPSITELDAFVKDKSKDKREKLVDKLLNDPAYTEEYAANWSTIWTNVLIGRNGGMEDDTLISRDGMLKYLRDSFARNKPYDRMVFELVTATGSTKPGTDNFNGASNFLVMKVNEEMAVQATAAVSKVFLGLQVQCTQCHNHPFNQWKQQKFWEFNAFFRQTRALRRFVPGGRDIDHAELVDQDFAGEGGQPSEAEIFYQLRNGLTKVAFPVFVDGTEIGKSGYVTEVNRRLELGKLVLQSEFLPKMAVNRMWSHFMGYGFTRPIDDLGPHNPSSHPELLEQLAQEFKKASYDNKALIKWIVLSQPYQLSSRATKDNQKDDPASGESPKFTHFYTRQMQAEELYQSLVVVAGTNASKGNLDQQQRQRDMWLRQFIIAFGTDEGDEATTFNGTIPQALMMFNGELVQQATSLDKGSWLKQLADAPTKNQEKVNQLFLVGLARKARAEELAVSVKLLQAREGKVDEMLQDMWWAILNSNEFIINH